MAGHDQRPQYDDHQHYPRLGERSPQGLTLTPAGELIYTEAKKLIQHSNTVLRKARALERPKETVIRVGVSLMNPANTLLELWARASERFPNIRLEVVPYEDTVPAFLEVLDHMGEKIDLISCPYTTTYWGDRAEPPPDSIDRGGLSRHGHFQSVGVLRAAAGVGLLLERGPSPAGHNPAGMRLYDALRLDLRQGAIQNSSRQWGSSTPIHKRSRLDPPDRDGIVFTA